MSTRSRTHCYCVEHGLALCGLSRAQGTLLAAAHAAIYTHTHRDLAATEQEQGRVLGDEGVGVGVGGGGRKGKLRQMIKSN